MKKMAWLMAAVAASWMLSGCIVAPHGHHGHGVYKDHGKKGHGHPGHHRGHRGHRR